MIRAKRPARIIEIGSGQSTLIALKAIKMNQHNDSSYKCNHMCIEPYENPWLERAGVHVLRQPAEQVDLSFFLQLDRNDLLFIDSSHMIRPQGDVLFEYLEVLPSLRPGVIVHIHDIFSPKDYPEDWIVNKVRFWNEQYLAEAFLTSNKDWKILASLNYLRHSYYDLLSERCPFLTPEAEPGSFYIQKVN